MALYCTKRQIVWWSGTTPVVSDRFSKTQVMPEYDSKQDPVLVPAESIQYPNNTWIITFTKTIAASQDDPDSDRDWPKVIAEFVYAIGKAPQAANPSAEVTIHLQKDRFSANLWPGDNSTPNPSASPVPKAVRYCPKDPQLCITVSGGDAAGSKIKVSITGTYGKYTGLGWGGKGMQQTDYAVSIYSFFFLFFSTFFS
jgi:hypothetical protein